MTTPHLRNDLSDRLDNFLNLLLNPIDRMIHELGGPTQVAELSGRSHRCVVVSGNYQVGLRIKYEVEDRVQYWRVGLSHCRWMRAAPARWTALATATETSDDDATEVWVLWENVL